MKNTNFLARLFGAISNTINGMEKSFLDLLSAIVPYFVPIIPAYLTYYHTRDQMDFPNNVAYTAAFVVEVLGITSVSTAIRFYRHNLRYKDVKNRAPFWLAVATYAFYLAIVLLVNVILEIVAGKRDGWVILSIGLFSLLSVPSGVLISIRTQFAEMLEERTNRYAPQPAPVYNAETRTPTLRTKHASDYREKIISILEQEYKKTGNVPPPKEITSSLKLDHSKNKGFVSTLRKQWMEEKGIERSV